MKRFILFAAVFVIINIFVACATTDYEKVVVTPSDNGTTVTETITEKDVSIKNEEIKGFWATVKDIFFFFGDDEKPVED